MTDQISINKLALTSSEDSIPYQLSGDPNSLPRKKIEEDPNKYKAPSGFIWTVLFYSMAMLVVVAVQWIGLAQISALSAAIILKSEWLLMFYWIAFLLLLALIFFYDDIYDLSKIFFYIFVIFTVEASSTVLSLPCAFTAAHPLRVLFATLTLIGIVCLSIIFTRMRGLQIDHEADYALLGGIRVYMMCAVANLVSESTSWSPYLEILVSTIIIPFMICFIFVHAKTLGTRAFYDVHGTRIVLCALSTYYCYVSIYTSLLIFFENVGVVLN